MDGRNREDHGSSDQTSAARTVQVILSSARLLGVPLDRLSVRKTPPREEIHREWDNESMRHWSVADRYPRGERASGLMLTSGDGCQIKRKLAYRLPARRPPQRKTPGNSKRLHSSVSLESISAYSALSQSLFQEPYQALRIRRPENQHVTLTGR